MRSHYVLALISFSIFSSLEASVNITFDYFKANPATLNVVSQNSDTCSNGPLKYVGDVLMVGPVITMPLSGDSSESDGCKEVTEVKREPKKISLTNKISDCPKENKNLEAQTRETIELKGKTLLYTRNENVKCVFEWKINEKK